MRLLRANSSQTFMIGAIDPRIAAAFPCVMVSTAMQGGCTCENTSCLRLGTGNVEIAACLAPRPLGLTAANDWTHEIETVGLPELKQHYAMLGVPDRVQGNKLEFGHNYNARSRALMYGFFNKVTATTTAALALFRLTAVHDCCAQHFELGFGPEQLVEQDYIPLSLGEATVWAGEYEASRPILNEETELRVLRGLAEATAAQMDALTPTTEAELAEWRKVVGGEPQAYR